MRRGLGTCCDMMKQALGKKDAAIPHLSIQGVVKVYTSDSLSISASEGTFNGNKVTVEIKFCPWCGQSLEEEK